MKNLYRLLSAVLLCCLSISCMNEGSLPNPDSAHVPKANGEAIGGIELVVSVDWEGSALKDKIIDPVQIEKFRRFRELAPDTPLLQLVNPALFTKRGADKVRIAEQVRSVMKPGDELGIHIHGWKNLVEAAGVTYRDSLSIYDTELARDPDLFQCDDDCGYGVPLTVYSTEDMRKLLKFSVREFRDVGLDQGYNTPRTFRAAAWVYGLALYRALIAENFELDVSPISYEEKIARDWAFAPKALEGTLPKIFHLLVNSRPTVFAYLFGNKKYSLSTTESYAVSFGQIAKGQSDIPKDYDRSWENRNLKVMIANGGTSDSYWRRGRDRGGVDSTGVVEILESFKKVADVYRTAPDRIHYLQFVMHFDYAESHATFSEGLAKIFEYSRQNNIPLSYAPLPLLR
ncbi:MAG: hypothetical protein K2X47_06500 [Bdellovibrionales bacterium]|nr:hypothetical protein [Bdellovibrionales bacterium]